MKKTTWAKKWISAVLAIGVVWSHALPIMAQDGEGETTVEQIEQEVTGLTTNAVVSASDQSEATSLSEADATSKGESDRRNLGDMVVFGSNVEVKAGESAKDIVVFFGTVTVRGSARDAVAIMGNIVVDGGKTKDAVAIMGNVRAGTNSSIDGDAVAIMGNIKLAPGAKVRGDTVAVGGGVEKSDTADVGGDIVGLPGFTWVGDYLEECVYKLRPLSPHLGWLWVVAGGVFLLYLLIAVALPRPVNACVEEIARRPATTFLIGLMTKILVLPLATVILAITGIGVLLLPFLFAAAMFAGIVGKIALLQHLGQQFERQSGVSALQRPLFAFIFGSIIITILYLVPVLGFIVFSVTGLWAIGAAVMAMFGSARRELPPSAPSPPAQTMPGTAARESTASTTGATTASTLETGEAPITGGAGFSPAPMAAPTGSHGPVSEVLTFPRATFWERMGAGFLDIILVSILSALVGGLPLGLLVALAYFAGMWAWRGTTIGGIVLNLKVVRYDGQPMSFAVALVRVLMAAFSVIVLFLGFLWIAWDRDRKGWHDQIAGTIVVRLPHGTPLICL